MPELPQNVDRFKVSRILGKGGMGTVYLARDERLERSVAVKVLHVEDLATEERRTRFMREARTAASIRHPNIATIYEVGETPEGVPFLVMEYCEGETLTQRLRRRPLEAGEFMSIARQIAAGVAAAHDGGVVHRDLKPANIIIEPTGQVKILDFGLAKALQPAAAESADISSNRLFGTLHYLSPEQARGASADERSDLFSVGVILYQMATGQLPFNADAPLMVLEKVRDAEPEPFVARDPAFPAPAVKIIGKLLQKDPKQRYQTARELLLDIEDIDTPTARFSVPLPSRSSIGRTRPRHALRALAIVVAALLAGGAVLYFIGQRQKPQAEPVALAAPGPIRSMAVMPLENISPDTKDDFLSVGLADALVTKLQQIPSLQVRPTSAVADYRKKKIDMKSASEKLRVDGLLEGRFFAAGDTVQVNLQLTDTRTGYNVWADTVGGNRANLIKLIDDVSSHTLTGLNQKLGVSERGNASEPRSSSPRAFEEYLKSRSIAGSLVPAEYQQQLASLRRAVSLDPNFAAAYADLAIAYSLGLARGLMHEQDSVQRAVWFARQAVRIDPNLPAAHLALGRAFAHSPNRFRESARSYLAALRLNQNEPQALNSVAGYFIAVGDTQKAQCVGDRMLRLDPNSSDAKTRGYWYVNAVDPERALQASQAALASRDTALAGHDIRANAFLISGNITGAESEAQQVVSLVPQHYLGKSLKAMIAAANGDKATALAMLKTFEPEANRNHWASMRQAFCYAKLGDRDNAVRWTKRAAELGDRTWYAWVRHPWLNELQGDPEFQASVGAMRADLDDVRDDMVGVYQLICR
jgi:eukaryotic-like serine/threonine-protein kinase